MAEAIHLRIHKNTILVILALLAPFAMLALNVFVYDFLGFISSLIKVPRGFEYLKFFLNFPYYLGLSLMLTMVTTFSPMKKGIIFTLVALVTMPVLMIVAVFASCVGGITCL